MSLVNITIFGAGIAIVLLGGIAILGIIFRVAVPDSMGDRLAVYGALPDVQPQMGMTSRTVPIKRLRMRFNNVLTVFIPKSLSDQLLSANWAITESEYVIIRLWLVVTGFLLVFFITHSWISGIGLAIIGYLIPPFLLNRSIYQRRLQFANQLVDVLMLLSGAVRAGYSLQQSLGFIIQEMKAPASEEFKRVQYENGLGLPFGKALLNLSHRMQNEDLYLVVTAININSQVGGNLVTMLDAVTNTIRDRVRLYGEIRALTAQQRFSSYILTLIPFAFAGLMFLLNPSYILRVFRPDIYLCFPIGAFISTMLGNFVIRKLSNITV